MPQSYLTPDDLTALGDLKRAASACGVPMVMVGAGARLLVFDLVFNIASYRTTTDWDFMVRVSDWAEFQALREQAMQFGYEETTRLHVLIHRTTRVHIDLVPFGGVARDALLRWPSEDSVMDLTGVAEAYEQSAQVTFHDGLQLRVATPPLLAVLKCFAFADRHQKKLDDLRDLVFLAEHYLTDRQEQRLFDFPFKEEAARDDFDWRYGGALVLGYDMAEGCRRNTTDKILPIIEPLGRLDHPSLIAYFGICIDEEEEDRKRRHFATLFEWLRRGLMLGDRAG
jgi:predicted nucleotidyltransferase